MWRSLVFGRFLVLKTVQHGGDVMRHGDFDIPLGVIPVDGESTVEFAIPVFCDGVQVAQSSEEVQGMFFAFVFDAEVVDDEGEGDGSGVVAPERWGEGDWVVSRFGEVSGEAVVGDLAGLL